MLLRSQWTLIERFVGCSLRIHCNSAVFAWSEQIQGKCGTCQLVSKFVLSSYRSVKETFITVDTETTHLAKVDLELDHITQEF